MTHHVEPAGTSSSSPLTNFYVLLVAAVLWCVIFLISAYKSMKRKSTSDATEPRQTNRRREEW